MQETVQKVIWYQQLVVDVKPNIVNPKNLIFFYTDEGF